MSTEFILHDKAVTLHCEVSALEGTYKTIRRRLISVVPDKNNA